MPDEGFKKRLILTDGTVLEDCDCGYSNKTLWCFLKGILFGEAFQYFSSPKKFQTVIFELEYMDFIDHFEYSGFEAITSVVQSENTVDVCLEGYKIETTRTRIVKKDGD